RRRSVRDRNAARRGFRPRPIAGSVFFRGRRPLISTSLGAAVAQLWPSHSAHRRSRFWSGIRLLAIALAGLLLALRTSVVHAGEAPGSYRGALEGAVYVINVPPGWNGGLVMFAHG